MSDLTLIFGLLAMNLPAHVDVDELAFAIKDGSGVPASAEAERPFYAPSFVAAWKNDLRKKCEDLQAALIQFGPTSCIGSGLDADQWATVSTVSLDVHAAPAEPEIADRLVASFNRTNLKTGHRALSSILCMKPQFVGAV